MQIDKVIENIKKLYSIYTEDEFIYQFIEAFSFYPKNTIARLKGDRNLSKNKNELLWKDKVFYVNSKNIDTDIHILADSLKRDAVISKNKIRFLIITNFDLFLSIDIKTSQSLECKFIELHKFIDFFLPLIGVEKFVTIEESPADIKASNNLGKLYDQILKDNKSFDLEKNRYSLNIFFTRLLFLYYADDSGVFEKNLFLKTLGDFTKNDGSDLDDFFSKLFKVLKTKETSNVVSYLEKFPYVNGFLFNDQIKLPKFTKKSRDMILQSASLDWQNINPDILGSMLQEVVSPEERDEEEMHYTSVSNILNVLDPLFLNELREKFDNALDDEKKLKKILKEIYSLKIFDPACGSGNFLIIAYKQLCLIEIEIIKKLKEINPDDWNLAMPGIKLSQFYGIEKSHFATETAKLSLWLAEHQMNFFYKDVFEKIYPSLPIENNTNIICENSIRVSWEKIFIKETDDAKIIIVGNPPFKSKAKRNKAQQEDVKFLMGKSSILNYVGLWFIKSADFTDKFNNTKIGLLATNSINKGEQVEILWEKILKKNIKIFFAHKSFKWKNNARNNATVIVSIICMSKKNDRNIYLVSNEKSKKVENINPYLISGRNTIVKKISLPIFSIPVMTLGEMARDGGNLFLDLKQKEKLLLDYPICKKIIRPFIGAEEFIDGIKRWCLWIEEKDLKDYEHIPFINDRLKKVKAYRLKSTNATTRSYAKKPFRFVEIRRKKQQSIFIPENSTSNRKYVPIGYADENAILSNKLKIIYSSEIYLLSLLSSKMHNVWIDSIGGKYGPSFIYSTRIIYNNFPIPEISIEDKNILTNLTYELLDTRDKFFDKNISYLYNNETMPNSLKKIHQKIDDTVDQIYSKKSFFNDDERLLRLFNLYSEKTLNKELF